MTSGPNPEADDQAEIDRRVIAALQDDAIADHREIEHLRAALVAARRIGAAVGIVMAERKCSELAAFELLRTTSHNTNNKLRNVADDVVLTGVVPPG